jgi:IS5 family transposase
MRWSGKWPAAARAEWYSSWTSRCRSRRERCAAHERVGPVAVDTAVQPKAITFPSDAKLLHAAIRGINRLARRYGVRLRQSYLRIAKQAAMMAKRYAHAKQFNRHRRQLRVLRTRLGRIVRDISRKIAGQRALEEAFAWPLAALTTTKSDQN